MKSHFDLTKTYPVSHSAFINILTFNMVFLLMMIMPRLSAQCDPDTEAPSITCPADITVVTNTGQSSAVVNYTYPIASDNCETILVGSETFAYTGNIQSFTIPSAVDGITIQAKGAQGGSSIALGGLGADMQGTFTLIPGNQLQILVGQQGSPGYGNGGGGGSFVANGTDFSTGTLLLAAGGGGGAGTSCGGMMGGPGQSGTFGGTWYGTGGGSNGSGGKARSSGGGGGFFSDGDDGTYGGGGQAAIAGGAGGIDLPTSSVGGSGGFGGGGAGGNRGGGGGGGYSGGGGASNSGGCGIPGGGGGSFNVGSAQLNTSGSNSGNGSVTISWSYLDISVSQISGLPSGSAFPVGVTTNVFEVTDVAGNITTCSFDVIIEADMDGDGFGSDDCDDTDPTVYPGAPEICDGKDNDCDGFIPSAESNDITPPTITCPNGPSDWMQLGQDIDGEAKYDASGSSVSLDGDRMAIGAYINDGNGEESGHVRVYEWDGSDWVQLGLDIDGEASYDRGHKVSLNGDRLAIGARWNDGNGGNSGHVRVFEWDGSDWVQLGLDIDGEASGDASGHSVSLNGERLAIGAIDNDGNGNGSGHVRVFEWDGSDWVQLGLDIDGEASGDASGFSVSLQGDRLAIGAKRNDGNGSNSGHVRVYEWNGNNWVQLGMDIDGEASGDASGHSVSLDDDRLAIGAPGNDGNVSISGHVRVYEWDGSDWMQLGLDIDGEASNDNSGTSVSLHGDRLAIGAPYNDGNGSSSGHVRVFEWDGSDWVQLGLDIDGEVFGDLSGNSVSLSGDHLAIGADRNDGNGSNSGHVRVYEWDNDLTAISSEHGLCGAEVYYSSPVAIDECPNITVTCSPEVGSFFDVGTTAVTCTATDPSGNSASCSFDIVVVDTEIPEITCPERIVVDNEPGLCGAGVNYSAPIGTDNCTGATTMQSDATGLTSGQFFPVGTTTLEYTVTDRAGNMNTCTFDIIVKDAEPAVARCQDITVQLNALGTVDITPEQVDNGSSDTNCDPMDQWSLDQTTFTTEDLGVNEVTLTVGDGVIIFNETGQNISYYSLCSELGDLDNDGNLDLFISTDSSHEVWLNDGNGGFTWFQSLSGGINYAYFCDVELVDIDDDGDLDAMATGTNNKLWMNDGTGMFTDSGIVLGQSTSYGGSLSLGDLDADGDLDVLSTSSNDPANIWINNGGGTYTNVQSMGSPSNYNNSGDLGDLDGDGDLDLIITPGEVWFNDGSGSFIDSGQSLGLSSYSGFSLGDLDDDGDLDAFLFNSSSSGSRVLLNDGSGYFSDSGQIFGPFFDALFVDIDNDDDLDVFASYWSPPNQLLINDGSGSLTDSDLSFGSCSMEASAGDINGDGLTDIITDCWGTQIFINNSSFAHTCTSSVTINEALNIDCPVDIVQDVDPSMCTAVIDYTTPTASGSSAVDEITVVCSPPSGSVFPLGTTLVTCTATDASNNTATCTFNVTINDTEPPDINCPAEFQLFADNLCELDPSPSNTGMASATDNCDSDPTITYSDASTQTFDGSLTDECFVITRTWLAVDDANNPSSCDQIIQVTNSLPPAWLITPAVLDMTIDCSDEGEMEDAQSVYPIAQVNCGFGEGELIKVPGELEAVLDCPQVGRIINTWTVTDLCGNISEPYTQVITLIDTTEPEITFCPADAEVPAGSSIDPVETGEATATDNCDTAPIVSFEDVVEVGDCPQESEITRVWKAEDVCGNTTYCLQTITIEDTTAPVIECPDDVMVNCEQTLDLTITGAATATDNVDSDVEITHLDISSQTDEGCGQHNYSIVRVWYAEDDCGNSTFCKQTITVFDITPPEITCPETLYVEPSDGLPEPDFDGGSTSDNCDGAVAVTFVSDVSDGLSEPETVTRTYRATDACGNTAECSHLIIIDDVTPPETTCSDPEIVSCIEDVPAPDISSVITTSDCGVTVTHVGDVSDGESCPETITRTYLATDECGNSITCEQTITVHDLIPPTMTCPGAVNVDCSEDIPEPDFEGGSTDDNCAAEVTVSHVSDISDGNLNPEVITRTYRATDACDNAVECTQTITVFDTEDPVITCPADINAGVEGETGEAFVQIDIPGVSDNCCGGPAPVATGDDCATAIDIGTGGTAIPIGFIDGTVSPVTVSCAFLSVQPSNSNWFSYTATEDGVLSLSSIGYGFDTQVQVLTGDCSGVLTEVDCGEDEGGSPEFSSMTVTPVSAGTTYYLAWGNAWDEDGFFDASFSPLVTGSIDLALRSVDTKYTLEDKLKAKAERTAQADLAQRLPDECGITLTNDITGTDDASGTYPLGTTTVTYLAVDARGNTSTCSFTVTVVDSDGPVLTCDGPVEVDNDAGLCSAALTLTPPTVSDNVTPSENMTPTSDAPSPFPVGETTVTWSAVDEHGNTGTCTQLVTVNDVEPPVIDEGFVDFYDLPFDPDLCGAEVDVLPPTASDNCGIESMVNDYNGTSSGLDVYPAGKETDVTWTVTDTNGNTTQVTATVKVGKVNPATNLHVKCFPNLNYFKLKWTPALGAQRYRIQVRDTNGNVLLTYNRWQPTAQVVGPLPLDILPPGDYQWRVITFCKMEDAPDLPGWQEYSFRYTSWKPLTLPCTAQEALPFDDTSQGIKLLDDGVDALLYPNPTEGIFYIDTDMEDYTLEVYDLKCKMVYNQTRMKKGITELDLQEAPNGMYLLKMYNNSAIMTKRVTIQR